MKLTQELANVAMKSSTISVIRPSDVMATKLHNKTIGQLLEEDKKFFIDGDNIDASEVTYLYPNGKAFTRNAFKFNGFSVNAGKVAFDMLVNEDPNIFNCYFKLGVVENFPGVAASAVGKPYFSISAPGNGLTITEKVLDSEAAKAKAVSQKIAENATGM